MCDPMADAISEKQRKAWERKYDPMDVARWKEDAEQRGFERKLLLALRNADVVRALREVPHG